MTACKIYSIYTQLLSSDFSVLAVKDHSLCPLLHSFCAKAMFSFSDTYQTIASDELMLCCSCYTIATSLQLEVTAVVL